MIKIKPWGYEEKLFSDNRKWIINEQYKTSIHKHSVDELILVDSGVILIEIGENPEELDSMLFLEEGSKVSIPANSWHRITALNDSIVFDFSRRTDEDIIMKDKSVGRKLTDEEFKKYLEIFLKRQQKDRIITPEKAESISNALKYGNKIIGYCSGCFDLMHFGHVEFLNQAKNRCDVLFVGIYTDNIVKSIKGEERPFIDEIGRFGLIESNRNVDYIVEINELDSSSAITSIKPNIYITTEDYTSPVEVKTVIDNGGKINIIPTIQGYSTTKLIMEIANSRKNMKQSNKNTTKESGISTQKGVYVPTALKEEDIPEIRL